MILNSRGEGSCCSFEGCTSARSRVEYALAFFAIASRMAPLLACRSATRPDVNSSGERLPAKRQKEHAEAEKAGDPSVLGTGGSPLVGPKLGQPEVCPWMRPRARIWAMFRLSDPVVFARMSMLEVPARCARVVLERLKPHTVTAASQSLARVWAMVKPASGAVSCPRLGNSVSGLSRAAVRPAPSRHLCCAVGAACYFVAGCVDSSRDPKAASSSAPADAPIETLRARVQLRAHASVAHRART